MKISVVTISYNQAEFLERAIQSVIGQDGMEVEYIIVDPGSTDGSRNIIERYRAQISHVSFEPDSGPADGLNKGFKFATGDIYCYLNSDDTFAPKAFARIVSFFETHPDVDVVCGHAWVTDACDRRLRRVWSEPFYRAMVAFGASIQIQPSTFIRRAAFMRAGGFNVNNKSNWDGELMVELFRTGAKIAIINEWLSSYRLHSVSITNSGAMDDRIRQWSTRRFELLMGRSFRWYDCYLATCLRLWKHVSSPARLSERLLRGPLYRRGV